MAAYDGAVPPSAAVQRWMRCRQESTAGYSMMYLDDALACSRGALTGQRACQLRCPAADLTSSTRRAGVGLLGLNTTISALMIRLATRSRTCPLAATIA